MSLVVGTTGTGETARDVVMGAMRDLGVIGLADEPEAEELRYGLNQLDLMLRALAAEGLVPWTSEDGQATFEAGEAEAVLTPRPAAVSEARFLSTGYQRSLFRWEAGEFAMIPNKVQRGTPVRFEIRENPTEVRMRLWPVPNAPTTIAYSYTREIEPVSASSVIDVPAMWGDALRKMLKARLTPFMPEGLPQYVLVEAEIAKQRLLDFERPESYQLGPQY